MKIVGFGVIILAMNSWRTNRQIVIFLTYFIVLSAPFILFAYFMLQKPETCFDTIKNQDEQAIDCGGVCSRQCKGTYKEVKVDFARGLRSDTDTYNIFALLENSNNNVMFPKIPYTVKAYNTQGDLLLTASGTTSILSSSRSAVYLPKISMKQPPAVVDIDLDPTHVAVRQEDFALQQSVKTSAWTAQRGANNTLQVVVKVENSSVKEFSDIDVYAMLYDDTNTVYAVGKTVLSNIKGRESTAAVFTWGDIASPANADFIVTQH
jgi:hypothetical protein